jgi:hypothetical protein
MIDDECGVGWNENWQGKPKYSEEAALVPLCPPQIPYDLARARTQAAAVGSLRPSLRVRIRSIDNFYDTDHRNIIWFTIKEN